MIKKIKKMAVLIFNNIENCCYKKRKCLAETLKMVAMVTCFELLFLRAH